MRKQPLYLLTVAFIFSVCIVSCSKSTDPSTNNTTNNNGNGGGNNGNGGGNNGNGGNTTTLTYVNGTFTPISITVNNQTQTIPVGGSLNFTGGPGTNLSGTATTSGKTSSGTQVGLLISWNINNSFPSTGTSTVNLNVAGNYFFLKIINTSAYTLQKVYVNYGLTAQTLDNISVPNDGKSYSIGYYNAYTNSNVRAESGNYSWTWGSLNLSFTNNQSSVVTANDGGGNGGNGGNTTTLTYVNDTYTPVSITANNQTKTIPVGGNVNFTGTPGSNLSGTATTSGQTSSGTRVGLLISWNINNSFPSSGATTVNLNVAGSYFFLKIINRSAFTLQKVYVNYGLTAQTLDNLSLPNDGRTYSIGYYNAYTNSNVRAESGNTHWTWSNLNLSFTNNQSSTVTAN